MNGYTGNLDQGYGKGDSGSKCTKGGGKGRKGSKGGGKGFKGGKGKRDMDSACPGPQWPCKNPNCSTYLANPPQLNHPDRMVFFRCGFDWHYTAKKAAVA